MKKAFFLTILLALVYAGYSYLQAVINFERLSNKIVLIISEPQSKSVESMEKAILAEAAKLGIPLSNNDIEIAVKATEKRSLGEKFIARPGIEAESKVLIVSFSYPIKIFGIVKDFSYNTEKVFTSKISLVVPYDEELNQ